MDRTPLDRDRLHRVKTAYTTRAVRPEAMTTLLVDATSPRAGDLVLARVDVIGQHPRIERPDGRRATLRPGDEVMVCYGSRYAPDQFEAEVPDDLGPCQLVAGGGVASEVRSRHGAMKAATSLTPIGLVADDRARRLNLRDWALPSITPSSPRPPTAAVVGTSMNSGKTTAAADLVRGLRDAGRTVGAAKVTGTGAGGDTWFFVDSGATPALDFTLAGHPSTNQLPIGEVVAVLDTLVAHLTAAQCDAIVLEIADGLFQRETAALLRHPRFRATTDRLLFAAGDAMGAVGGVEVLRGGGLEVAAVVGAVTASPLAVREASGSLDVPVLGRADLIDPATAQRVLPVDILHVAAASGRNDPVPLAV